MAPKKQKTLDPPPASISEEEVESVEEAQSGEEEEEEEEYEEVEEEEEEDEEEEEEEDEEEEEEEEESRKQKLPTENGSSSQPPGTEKTEPRKLFERVWSDHDVTVLLKGLQDWHDKGNNPYANLSTFLESIQDSLHASVNPDQLSNKIKKLKEKYRRGKGGKDPKFSKPHDSKCYQIMKVIWAGDRKRKSPAGNCNHESASKHKTALVSAPQITLGLSACFRDVKNLSILGESLLKQGFGLLGDKAMELEVKLNKLQEEEEAVYLKRVGFIQEVTAALVNVIKSSDS